MKIKVEKPEKKEMERQGILAWPIWEKEVSRFDWHYDQQEKCYILEGEVTVTTAEEEVTIRPGDFVTFPYADLLLQIRGKIACFLLKVSIA